MSKNHRVIYFPHIIRIFSAITLWSFLGLLFSLNIYAKTTMSPSYWPEALAVLASPNTLSTHHLLAYKFWGSGYVSAAKREIQLAQISDNVLGVWESEPMRLSSEYSFWESVVREKPNYRDGFINLASLAYQLSKPDQAKEFLSQASRLDPNNEEVEKLFLFFGR